MKSKLIVLVAAASLLLPAPALASTRPCTSSEVSSIQSQQRTVDSRQRTVNTDQQNYSNAQQRLNTANARVNDLDAKRTASKNRLSSLLVAAAKNPTKAKEYADRIQEEKRTLASIESQHTSAVRNASYANTVANNALSKLSRSQKELGNQQAQLASKRSRCRI
jgi:septation ring formation regulator EzrA